MSVDYPVTGVIVVPTSTRNVAAYIAEREFVMAQLRLPVLVSTPRYAQTVAAMLMAPGTRRSMGIDPPMPPEGLVHGREAVSCEGCRVIARCEYSTEQYLELRSRFEQITAAVTQADDTFCQSLGLRLNTYAA
ncbi:MAG TPA: hypothetical protein VJM46_04405 [Candidatus Saccharimonadales bacterium]|nr:hypothetical protein [Candidatus Saccharimonadales bacterium]